MYRRSVFFAGKQDPHTTPRALPPLPIDLGAQTLVLSYFVRTTWVAWSVAAGSVHLRAKAHPIDTGEEVLAAAADHGLMNVKKMWDL